MVIGFASSVVDRGFIGGVMVIVFASSVVDRGFIGGVKVIVLASSVVDRGFKSQSCQTKDYEIGMCCFSAKHASSGRKSKDLLSWKHTGYIVSVDSCFSELAQ